jgi:hypothetical protein
MEATVLVFAGYSGAKHGCKQVTMKQSADVYGFTVYESWIYAKVLKKVLFS